MHQSIQISPNFPSNSPISDFLQLGFSSSALQMSSQETNSTNMDILLDFLSAEDHVWRKHPYIGEE